jgi:hypothetical protein
MVATPVRSPGSMMAALNGEAETETDERAYSATAFELLQRKLGNLAGVGMGGGQHRDNANKRQLVQHIQNLRDGKPSDGIIGHCASHGAENSQIPMTGTVVYTLGDGEMVLKMRFPPADNLTLNRKEYAIEPKFTCKLGPGTAFVLDVWDDMFFTHEAEFELRIEPMACAGESTCREAWAFRHMESLKVFGTEKASACGMVRTLDVCAKEKERKAKKAKQKANERRKMVQRMF